MAETVILYRNWRGETAKRTIILDTIAYGNEATGLGFGSNEWHPEEQWLLSAFDVEKGARRTFAMSGILAWGEAAITAREAALAEAEARGMRAGIERAADYFEAQASTAYGYHRLPADEIARQLRALATAAPAETEERGTGWRPIAEAPKDGTVILLWSGIVTRVGWWAADDEFWRLGGDSILRAPTHWIPLPLPPQPTATATREDGHA